MSLTKMMKFMWVSLKAQIRILRILLRRNQRITILMEVSQIMPQLALLRSDREIEKQQWVRPNLLPPQSIPFTGQPGIQVNTDGFEAIDYFELFINDDIINYLVTETNTFAEQFIRDNNLKRKSRVHAWQPTDPKEMKHFLGLTFLMGIIQRPTIQMYWSNDPFYSTPSSNK